MSPAEDSVHEIPVAKKLVAMTQKTSDQIFGGRLSTPTIQRQTFLRSIFLSAARYRNDFLPGIADTDWKVCASPEKN